jgi:segregation and condensation protein B
MSLKARIEAVIYAAEEPVTLAQLASLFREEALASRPPADPDRPAEPPGPALVEELSEPAAELPPDDEKKAARQLDRAIRDEIRALVDELIADYNTPDSGLEIREVAGGFRIGTRPENHDAVRAFIKTLKPPLKLSLQALETLAVIAYKQPVTAPEIGEIRGVDTSGVLGSLVARKLITTAGRKQVVGRPILYKTTKEFLLRFGLKDVNELPSIEEFEKMAADLAEPDLAEPEEVGALTTEQELPFAQNEIAEIEDDAESSSGDLDAAEPAPTSEHDIAEQPK